MSEQKKNNTVRVGQVLVSKDGETEYLVLGNTNDKAKAEYKYDVDVRITKANGEKLVLKNPRLFFNDPRKFSKTPEKIPAFIKSDVVFLKEE